MGEGTCLVKKRGSKGRRNGDLERGMVLWEGITKRYRVRDRRLPVGKWEGRGWKEKEKAEEGDIDTD